VTGKRLHELEYEDGYLKSFANFKDSSVNNRNGNTSSCVDWYWVTTYYDESGMQINQTWDYVGTTCQGEDCQDPYVAMLCPMGNEGGGGASEGYEFEAHRQKSWEVYASSVFMPSWSINALIKLKGRRDSNEPQGGYFTDANKLGVSCSGCAANGVSWDYTLDETSYSGQSASHHVIANYTRPGQSIAYANKTENFSFQTVFP
jgi:hypothetical protein